MKTATSVHALMFSLPILLCSCGDSSNPAHYPVTSRSFPNRESANEAAGRPDPGKDYPVAERIDGRPDLIRSPYTQEAIEITRLKKGPLVEDPTVRLAKRYFLMPAN
jgi:hypothetical protein